MKAELVTRDADKRDVYWIISTRGWALHITKKEWSTKQRTWLISNRYTIRQATDLGAFLFPRSVQTKAEAMLAMLARLRREEQLAEDAKTAAAREEAQQLAAQHEGPVPPLRLSASDRGMLVSLAMRRRVSGNQKARVAKLAELGLLAGDPLALTSLGAAVVQEFLV